MSAPAPPNTWRDGGVTYLYSSFSDIKMRELNGIHTHRWPAARRSGMSQWLLWLLLCAVPGLLCGCRQKELVYPASAMIGIEVVFDWSYAPEAAPDGMSLVFFPEGDDGRVWRYELAGHDGGEIEIPAGRYRMMAFNNDTKYIMYSGTSRMGSYNAYTEETAPVVWPEAVRDSFPELLACKVYHSPDPLYCATAEDVTVELCSVTYRPGRPDCDSSEAETKKCGRHVLRCFPAPRTSKYTCILRNVTGIDGFRRGYYVLSGLSPSELIAYDILSPSEGEYMFIASRGGTEITGSTYAFGSSADLSAHQYLYFIAVLADGSVAAYCRDVSAQIENSPDKRNVIIIIDGIDLPEVDPGDDDNPDTSFDVAVQDWETVIINHVVTL